MTEYFKEELLDKVKKQRSNNLIIFIVVSVFVLLVLGGLFWWYRTLPYQSPTILTVKIISGAIAILYAIFAFIFMGIKFKRVNKFYKLCVNLKTGIRETYTGSFIENDEEVMMKDGVDFKSLIFLEYNKYKKDFFERKVLVFEEMPFPEFKEGDNVKFITQGNVLISYEILS